MATHTRKTSKRRDLNKRAGKRRFDSPEKGRFMICVDASANCHGLVVEGQVTAGLGSGMGRSRDLDNAGVRAVSIQWRDVSFTSGSPSMLQCNRYGYIITYSPYRLVNSL